MGQLPPACALSCGPGLEQMFCDSNEDCTTVTQSCTVYYDKNNGHLTTTADCRNTATCLTDGNCAIICDLNGGKCPPAMSCTDVGAAGGHGICQ